MRKLALQLLIPLNICLLLLGGFVRFSQDEDLELAASKSEVHRNFTQQGKKGRAHSLHLSATKGMKARYLLQVVTAFSPSQLTNKEAILGRNQRLKRAAFGISLFRPPIFA